MIQVVTLLADSFRMLLARRLFWVSVILSSLLAIIYLSISLEPEGVGLFFGLKMIDNPILREGSPEGEYFYITLFSSYLNRYWLGSGAILLALISTVSVFPEFTRAGSIEISLSKPVSRLKLFAVKYIGCLLFVAIQTSIFAGIIFLAIGLRLGYWNYSVFWVIPIITFVFSLLHCVQVLVGVITRSSLAALLSALCFWVIAWSAQIAEQTLYLNTYAMVEEKMSVDWKSGKVESHEERQAVDPAAEEDYQLVKKLSMPLPKVRDVTLYLDQLVQFRDSGSVLEQIDLLASVETNELQYKSQRAERRTRERSSPSYFLLTSLGFELVLLSLACVIFVRKDY
ncbi:ABC transporter permease subunit [Rubritalea sp.]|uniref:ABC transporter permease subunit n=1 Tax=Rubritalea sp. TaxID=2109375 RepID=UPI003EF58E9E